MRKQLVESDPLLFGESLGLVERISSTPEAITVEGWVTSDNGDEVGAVCVELDGQRHLLEEFEKIDRDDVRRHLGKRKGRFGFRVRVSATRGGTDDIASRLRVSAGVTSCKLGAPLPFASGGIVEC
jgi:hypothetical protein